MLERLTMASLLTTAGRRLHHWADLLTALLRWLVLPTLCPVITRQGLSTPPPCYARTASTSVSARRVKDGLRVLTYGEVARARRVPCRGGGGGGGGGEVETCAVCLGELRRRDTVRVPRNCRHVYHRQCLDRWIDHDEQGTCPLCRAPLLTPTVDDVPSLSTPATHESREQEQRCSWAVEQLLYLFGDDLLPPSPSPSPAPSSSHCSH